MKKTKQSNLIERRIIMYRTEEWVSKLKSNKLRTPVTVPSYHRPNAPIFTSKIAKALTKDEFFVCIRNDPSEIANYKWLEEQSIATLVLLENVHDLGETKGAIVAEFYKRGYKNIFMFDDTVTNLIINAPHVSKGGKTYFGNAKWSDTYSALLLWEYLHNEYIGPEESEEDKGAVYSSVGQHKGYDWEPSLINASMCVNNKLTGNMFCIDIQTVVENNINYQSVYSAGVEDINFPYTLLKAGLIIRAFTDLSYCMTNTQKQVLEGGDNNASPRAQRLEHIRKIFVENTLHRNWGDSLKDLGLKYYKTKHEGIAVVLDWKYWRDYYKNHKTERR